MSQITLPAQFVVSVWLSFVVANLMLLSSAYLILIERKVAAWTQSRIGPNRTGFSFGQDNVWRGLHMDFMNRWSFGGLGQALADGAKLLFKEDYSSPNVDRRLFLLAPVIVVIPAVIGWAVVPWGGLFYFPGFDLGVVAVSGGWTSVAVAPVSIGVVYFLAVSSLAVYGMAVGAYASNNKYSFFGGMRAVAQMLSYEIPMGLIVLILILTFKSTDAGVLVNAQAGSGANGTWGIFMHPFLAVIFFICVLAETNRAPFDLAEAEQELVGGFHTEYSSMKWALFFLGEYMNMITGSAFVCILFLGGWDLIPFVELVPQYLPKEAPWLGALGLVILKFLIFAAKIASLLLIMMWVRWTLPRLRFDQLMKLAWRGLIPLMLAMLLCSGAIVYLDRILPTGLPWLGAWFLAANIAVALIGMLLGPKLPQGPPVNRRIPLSGSRFSPPPASPPSPTEPAGG